MTKKSILIDSKAHVELSKLTESLNMNFGSLIAEMIYYFKKTGINPKNSANENPSIMVAALDKRIVSFLKVQERDILKPLRQEVFNYQNSSKEQIAELNKRFENILSQHAEKSKKMNDEYKTLLNTINKFDNNRTNLIKVELENNRKVMLMICNLIDQKYNLGARERLLNIFK